MKKLYAVFIYILSSSPYLIAQENEQDSTSTSQNNLTKPQVPYTVSVDELYLKDDLLASFNFFVGHGVDKYQSNGTLLQDIGTFQAVGNLYGGYFIADRFAIGLGVFLDVAYIDTPGVEEDTNVQLFGGPFIRYYVIDKLFINLLGGYGIANNKYKNGVVVTNTNYNGIFALGGLGYDVFLNETKDVALQIGANYVFKLLTNSANDQFEIQTGKMQYNIGLVFYFF